MIDIIQNIDFKILNFIQEHIKNSFLDTTMVFITKLGNAGFIFLVLTVVFLLMKKTREIGLTLAVSQLLGLLIVNIILKPSIARIRPYEINQSIELLINKLKDYSFPSGHTYVSFAFATGIFLYNKKYGILAYIFAFLMGFSRLYLYVHFPTDVLFGALIGIGTSLIAYFIIKKFYVNENNISLNK